MPEFVIRVWTSVWTRFFSFCTKVELPRKIWHVLSISGAAWLSFLLEGYWLRIGVATVSFVAFYAFERIYRRYNLNWFRAVEREAERNGRRSAVPDFLAALVLGTIFFPPEVLTTALLVTAWCDPAAAFIGQATERPTRWSGSRKSVEGTVICFMVAATVVLVRDPVSEIWVPLSVAFVAATTELQTKQRILKTGRFAGWLTPADNFWITISSGMVLWIAYFLTIQKGPII